MREGVDYSWGRPSGASLKAAGKDFVVRYLFDDGQGGKGLDPSEIADLRANGIDIAVVYEEYANSFRGRDAGIAQAHRAQAALNHLDLPKDLPIYFAVDWDSTPGDQAAIDEACRGAAAVIGLERVGIYGSYYVIERCKAADTARWFWQTYAWSGGQVSQHNHLYQYRNAQEIAGHAVDFTKAVKSEFGQHGVSGGIVNTPSPSAVPQPSVVGKYTVVSGDNLSKIAERFGITWQALYAYGNNRATIGGNPNEIKPGQVLDVPSGTPPKGVETGKHTVVSGENLSVIAARFGWSWQQLYNFGGNRQTVGADPNKIKAGQVLDVPSGDAPAPAPAPSEGEYYTVVRGDTVDGICRRFGIDIANDYAAFKAMNPDCGHNGVWYNIWADDRVRVK
nr:MAG TPA: Cell wall hydrolase autolysin [Caudoviricetes sp.]